MDDLTVELRSVELPNGETIGYREREGAGLSSTTETGLGGVVSSSVITQQIATTRS